MSEFLISFNVSTGDFPEFLQRFYSVANSTGKVDGNCATKVTDILVFAKDILLLATGC